MAQDRSAAGSPLHEQLQALIAAKRPSISFEFFPPKTDEAEAVLWQSIRRLEPLNPTFVSVTYGAGGSSRDRTTRVTQRIAQDTTLTPMAHLTCVGASLADLRGVIADYAAAGVKNVLVVRGDPAGGPRAEWVQHEGGPRYAVELVKLVRELGNFSVGVAAFPDIHPASADLDADARVLAMKAEAGAQFAITQMFFRPQAYFDLVERAASLGCTMPIIPGVMPVTNVRQVERIAELTGVALPAEVVERLHAVADEPAAVRQVGVEIATELCQELLQGGAPGLHFITMNRSTATLEVAEALGLTARV
ncbi:methylenetetrahydrofolate reductase [NAD(P)H] [Kineosporia rhizophila]|uniref:methylenetetrahydrofolate reductase [NAD(P)H] n=1 Tax=Kineosporia TaxID=49184 RepID=UPI001E59A024|nr:MULTISPECIES: methylenetetrahydrofolate reductase [NAD(P)H] [Kineosporia]MCE0538343.1 methylenetetrahydrofolate reductase [NAD(P)H] [Kineosporia rhizophila]